MKHVALLLLNWPRWVGFYVNYLGCKNQLFMVGNEIWIKDAILILRFIESTKFVGKVQVI